MAIIGAILGDIAGSPFEFNYEEWNLQMRKDNKYDLYNNKAEDYRYTDDTILSIACMEACETDLDFAKAYRTYANKYPTADYGGGFRKWLKAETNEGYNSFGNGSAMRCSYIGEKYDLQEVSKIAEMSAMPTHNHEEGIKGAIVIATCIAMAKEGYTKEEILEYGIYEYPSDKYKYGCDIPYNHYKDIMGYEENCQGSVPVAIRCFYESNNFEDCIRKINAMSCDTDTVCAIAGGLCEEYYGHCMGSPEKDEALIRKYLSKDLIEVLEKYGCFDKKKDKDEIEV